jgi:hypothetical protein
VTVEGNRTPKLFKDFEAIVSGERDRRRGETVHLPQLRAWMTRLAGKVEAALRTYAEEE